MRTNRRGSKWKRSACGSQLMYRNDRLTIWSGLYSGNKYAELQELTPYALRELVKAIYIAAPEGRRQGVHICYDLVGFIPLDELMKQETA
ncbi:MAG: DUF4368 domain-containing protein [Oscillospiraceae bacterium]